jgi:hypothetical protein
LVEHEIDVRPESFAIDGWCVSEDSADYLRGNELPSSKGDQLSDRHPVPGHDEGLASVEAPHDLAAIVSQFPLGDLLGHVAIVALVRQLQNAGLLWQRKRAGGRRRFRITVGLFSPQ